MKRDERRQNTPLRSKRLLFSALMLAAVCVQASSASAQAGIMSRHAREPLEAVSPAQRSAVVATIDGEEITREMLYWYNFLDRTSEFKAADVLNLPPKDLKKLVEDAAITRIAVRRALEPDSGIEPQTITAARQQENEILISMLEEQEVFAKVGDLAPEEIRDFYQRNTEAFKIPLAFSVRHIFISHYQHVLTKQGDTLEGLARAISGDAAMVDYILVDNDAKSPRAPGYSKGKRATLKPLEPGEHLLVPISEAAKREKRIKIEAAMNRLRAGDHFTSVALEYTESVTRGEIVHHLEHAGKPLLPEVVRVVKNTPVGAYSDIFETKHGYNIIKVERKTDERLLPLEQVEAFIQNRLRSQKRAKALDDYTRTLYAIPDMKIDLERFKNPETPGETPVVSLDDRHYPRMRFAIEHLGPTSKDMRDEDALNLIRADSLLRADLKVFQARKIGLDKTAEYRGKTLGVSRRSLREAYFQAAQTRLATEEISEEKAREFFEKNRDEFMMRPYFTFYLLAIRVEDPDNPEEVRKAETRARELVLPVRTLDQFKRVIQENGERFAQMRENGLLENIPEVDIGPRLLGALQSLRTGQMAPPLYEQPFVLTPWLVSRTSARPADYEEVKPRLSAFVRERKLQTFPDSEIEELLKETTIILR